MTEAVNAAACAGNDWTSIISAVGWMCAGLIFLWKTL